MKERTRSYFSALWPAYLNGQLGLASRTACRLWLRIDPYAQLELDRVDRLRMVVLAQKNAAVPDGALSSIQREILGAADQVDLIVEDSSGLRGRGRLSWVIPVVLGVLALVAVWFALPPVIALEWSVIGEQPDEFRVYRARVEQDGLAGIAEYELLNQIPADNMGQPYSFNDLQLIPGQQYLYRVEAVDVSGGVVQSSTTLGNSISALPGLLILLAAAMLLLYGLVTFAGGNRWVIDFGSGGQRMVF